MKNSRLSLYALLIVLIPGVLHADKPSQQRQSELVHLVRHDCGSCHGMTLKGGLGPALLPERLAGMHPETLKATVMYGRAGTPMPPWLGILDEAEISWLVDRLIDGKLAK